MAAKKEEPVCCVYCGRDTRARDGVCARCRGCADGFKATDEQRGRKALRTDLFSASPLEPYHDDDEEFRTAQDEYNGDTFRDDV